MNIHGKLRFSVSYDREQSQFAVTVLDATDLPVRDFSQSTNPFVKVKLLSGLLSKQPNLQCVLQEWETKTVKNSRNPVFGSQFSCPLTEKELKTITLKLEVTLMRIVCSQIIFFFFLQGTANTYVYILQINLDFGSGGPFVL